MDVQLGRVRPLALLPRCDSTRGQRSRKGTRPRSLVQRRRREGNRKNCQQPEVSFGLDRRLRLSYMQWTLMPSRLASCTSSLPGSLTEGVPASHTNAATLVGFRLRLSSAVRCLVLFLLCSW